MQVKIESYSMIIVERKPDCFIIKCGSCKGTGCSSCQYTGHRRLDIPAGCGSDADVFRCGVCKGSGCISCDYVGAFVGGTPRVICGACSGDGCPACGYHGSIYAADIP